VSAALVERAAAEVFDTPARPPARQGGRRGAVALLGTALVGLVAAGWWLQQPRPPKAVPAVAAVPAPAAVPVSPAPAPAASTSAPDKLTAAVVDDPAALRALAQADEAQAWRELALHWNVAIGEGDPCVAARQAALVCFRSAGGGLGLLRSLSRPALLVLRAPDGSRSHALLVALDDEAATLQSGRQRLRLALPALAGAWRGEFATFWRSPPGWEPGPAGQIAARRWAAPQLASVLPAQQGQSFAEQVAAFPLLQGLPVDGQAGPLTLMQLSRVAGVPEPRLAAAVAEGG
jgi:general secretion pathway protein A